MQYPPVEAVVWGERACFTRPEMKVERVSYPVMTPSAARGILEAVFWKPEMYYQIREIQALNEIKWFSVKRNEVSGKASSGSSKSSGFFVDEKRTQRATLGLREVKYLIKADIHLKSHADKDAAAYRDQFRRRVAKGACFHRPALGCREFAAEFAPPSGDEKPIQLTDNLGKMLFDIDYAPRKDGKTGPAPGAGTPVFFSARLENGIMKVPQELYQRLRWSGKEKR